MGTRVSSRVAAGELRLLSSFEGALRVPLDFQQGSRASS